MEEIQLFEPYKIISRKEALAKGLKRYFTGLPCPKGHIAERLTSNFNCIECNVLSNKKFNYKYYKNQPNKSDKSKSTNRYGPFLTRKLAIKQGLAYYYDGLPCPNGHIDIKGVSGGCVECRKIRRRKEWLKDHPKKQGPKILKFGPFLTLKQAQEKGLDFYYIEPCFQCGSVLGYQTYKEGNGGNKCLVCRKSKSKEWMTNNLEKMRVINRRSSKTIKFKESRKKWNIRNRKKMNEWSRKYGQFQRDNKTQIAMATRIRGRINDALKNRSKGSSTIKLLGINSWDEIYEWIESQFQKGMTWDNWAHDGWHLDHVRPIATFDISDFEQQKTAFNWRNYQPLWGKENLSKQDTYTPLEELVWVERMQSLGYEGELFLKYEEGNSY